MVWSGESSRGARSCCGRTEAHFGTPLTYPFGGLGIRLGFRRILTNLPV
jgi:hypothetical protein